MTSVSHRAGSALRPIRRGFRGALSLIVSALLVVSFAGPVLAAPQATDSIDGIRYAESGVAPQVMPDVRMKAGVLVSEDGRVLWARNESSRRSIASITKIMTAVVALDSSTPTETVTVPKASGRVGESTAFLRPGESLPMLDLLEALLVKSGNDAAVAISRHVAGSEEDFVRMMNEKANELGLKNTHYSNPHGLDEEGNYSTASDLSVLTRYAMRDTTFRSIVSQKTATIGSGGRTETVENTNILIQNYSGANGVKTGWTDDAGYCVIDSASRDGIELYAVVLGTGTELQRFKDAKELLDFGFAHFRSQKLASGGSVIGKSQVTDYLDEQVPAAVSEDVTVTVFDLAGDVTRTITLKPVKAPIKAGERLGVATFTQGDRVIATVPLVSTEEIDRPNLFLRVWIALVRFWRWIT